jgi:hypothetical protein
MPGMGQSEKFGRSTGRSALSSIVLQKSKVATARFFRENLKRKEVDDSHSLSRTTEVAHEFGAGR